MNDSQQLHSTEIRSGYVTTDDNVRLHWKCLGSGIPMICSNGVGVSTFFWKYIAEYFQDRCAVLLWDYRGHGASDRDLDPHTTDMSVPRHAKDLCTVLAAAFPDYDGPVLLAGHSMGCQVSLEAYRTLQKRVKGMFLLLGSAGKTLSTFGNFQHSPLVFRAIRRLAFKIGPKVNRITHPLLLSPIAWPFTLKFSLVDPLYTTYEDFHPYLEHLATIDMLLFMQNILQLDAHDAWDLLPNVHCPTLVFAAEKDTFTPISCAQKMTNLLPFGELIVLADGSHAALIEQPEIINYTMNRFCKKHRLIKRSTYTKSPKE